MKIQPIPSKRNRYPETRLMHTSSRILLSLFLLVTLASPALGEDHPNVSRGFSPEKVYAKSGNESVDIQNGNVALTIPLGQRFPVDAGFSYGLSLIYNSEIWDFSVREAPNGEPGLLGEKTTTSNAGLGWRLTLGELRGPSSSWNELGRWVFVSPDGARHVFYKTLHAQEGGDQPANDPVMYTRDGSYLRLRPYDHPVGPVVDFPDGRRFVFEKVNSRFGPGALPVLRSIEDSFGEEYLSVDYSYVEADNVTCPKEAPVCVRLTDAFDRIHWVLSAPDDEDLKEPGPITSVELNWDPNTKTARSTYQFVYNHGSEQQIEIHPSCRDTVRDPVLFDHLYGFKVDLLTDLILPDRSTYKFEYFEHPAYDSEVYTCGVEDPDEPGLLRLIKYPTGGTVEYTYQSHNDWGDIQTPCGTDKPHNIMWFTGIKTKMLDGDSARMWTYDRAPIVREDAAEGCSYVTAAKVTVTPPTIGDLSTEKEYFFNVETPEDEDGAWMDGLPFVTDPTEPGYAPDSGRFLSSRLWENGVLVRSRYVKYEADLEENDPNITWATVRLAVNRRLMSSKTIYHDDCDPECRWASVDLSDFDGVGHYRARTTDGNFGGEDDRATFNQRSTFTEFNPHVGTYTGQSSSTPWWPETKEGDGPRYPWVLGTFGSTEITADAQTIRREFCFDQETGFLLGSRGLAEFGTQTNGHDVVKLNFSDTNGNLEREEFYGGDGEGQSLGSWDALCHNETGWTAPTSGPEYITKHSYQNGSRSKSWFDDGTGSSVGFYVLDLDIDAATGLPSKVRDISGTIETEITYDNMGRVLDVVPTSNNTMPVGASTHYTYKQAYVDTGTNELIGAQVIAHQMVGNEVQSAQAYLFDSFGRRVEQSRLMADGDWSTQATTYNARGWIDATSQWHDDDLEQFQGWTRLSGFDHAGRATTITAPDGKTVDLSYAGSRLAGSSVSIGTSFTGPDGPLDYDVAEETVTTTSESDRFGRTRRVVEPAKDVGTNEVIVSDYSYDVGGNLTQVVITPDGAAPQNRAFQYDALGRLKSEWLPEIGANGNGVRTYDKYDSIGNLLSSFDGLNTLVSAYDRAGRLTTVAEDLVNDRVLTELKYWESNGSFNADLGKLERAWRYHYDTPSGTTPSETVYETYFYGGRNGAISERQTNLGDALVRDTYEWDDLGNLAVVGYPSLNPAPPNLSASASGVAAITSAGQDLDIGAHTAAIGPSRYQKNEFSNGILTKVFGKQNDEVPLALLEYHENGMLARVAHSNGHIDSFGMDPNRMQRLGSLESTVDTRDTIELCWRGPFDYDGAGNIVRVGGCRYTYDWLSRLKSVDMPTGPLWFNRLGYEEEFHYDAFGNLTTSDYYQIEGGEKVAHFSADNDVNAATNRLVDATYDAAGNQTEWVTNDIQQNAAYDALNRLVEKTRGGVNGSTTGYIYTPDGERIAVEDNDGDRVYSIRGLDGKVLRDYRYADGNYTFLKDYIYRGGHLLATVDAEGNVHHAHLDHLGSTRAMTSSGGIAGSDSVAVTINSLNQGPTAAITAGIDGQTFVEGHNLILTGTAVDPEEGNISPNIIWNSNLNGQIGVGALIVATNLSLGEHELTATITDTGGLSDSHSITVHIAERTYPPVVTITDPPREGWVTVPPGDVVVFKATADDYEDGDLADGISWTSNLDGALATGRAFTTRELSEGTHIITASVTDSHGESGEDNRWVRITGDNTSPNVSIVTPVDEVIVAVGAEVTFSGEARDVEDGTLDNSIEWSVAGEWTQGSSTAHTFSNPGLYFVTAKVQDTGGLSATATINVQATEGEIADAPTVTITAPLDASSAAFGTAVQLRGTAQDAQEGDLSDDLVWSSNLDGLLGTGKNFFVDSLSVGNHTIIAASADSEGHAAFATIDITVTPAVVSIPVMNHSFEDDVLPDGGSTSTISGWYKESYASVVNPTDDDFDDPVPDGENVLQVRSWFVSQTFPGEEILPGWTYTVSADVGDGDHDYFGGYKLELRGSSAGAAITSSPEPADARFVTSSVGFLATEADVGNTLEIRLDKEGYPSDKAYFDNVQLVRSFGEWDPNSAPVVTITAPAFGASSQFYTDVTFTGVATDSEDGDLGSALRWSSDRDGFLGRGLSLTTRFLSEGRHVITADATDSLDRHGQAVVVVTIEPNPMVSAIPVANPSFEEDELADDTQTETITSWELSGDAWAENPADDDFLDDLPHGSNLARVDGEIYQTIQGQTILEGATYTLTVDVGREYYGSSTYYEAKLKAGSDLRASVSSPRPSAGRFVTVSTSFTATASDAGSELQVWLGQDGGADTYFDNVRLVREDAVLNERPVVTITTPVDGQVLLSDSVVPATGSAIDTEDGDISANLKWHSSLDGEIGNGSSPDLAYLSVGEHVITAKVTDSGFMTGSESITVTVVQDPAISHLTVANHSFEDLVLPDGDRDTDIPGWEDYTGYTRNPEATKFPGGVPDGENAAYVQRWARQTIAGETVQEGATYILSVEVGNAVGSDFEGYEAKLRVIGDTNVTRANCTSPLPGAGEFVTCTTSFTATAEDAGKSLQVRLEAEPSYRQTYFDNVHVKKRAPDTAMLAMRKSKLKRLAAPADREIATALLQSNSAGAIGVQAQATIITQPSNVAIAVLEDGYSYGVGEEIEFSATAVYEATVDGIPENRDVSHMIVWRSSIDGVIGAGPSITINDQNQGAHQIKLSPGDHIITASVAGAGRLVSYNEFRPFGQKHLGRWALNSDDPRMQFTGHERDANEPTDPYDDLDYMHARYYSPMTGRFLRVDPILGYVGSSQSWNNYSYVENNPIGWRDPYGLDSEDTTKEEKTPIEPCPTGNDEDCTFHGFTTVTAEDPFDWEWAVNQDRNGWHNSPMSRENMQMLAGVGESAPLMEAYLVLAGLYAGFGHGGGAVDDLFAAAMRPAGRLWSRVVLFPKLNKLQKGFVKHGDDFGVTGNWNPGRAAEFSSAINQHVNKPWVRAVSGTYRNNSMKVTHYVDPYSGLNVVVDSSGNYVTASRLRPEVLKQVLETGWLW